MLSSVALLATGLLALAVPAHADGSNLVVNSGFETGDLTGWSCDAGTGSVVGSPVHSGSHALAGAAGASDDAQCVQTVAVQPNSAYTLSAYVQGAYVYLGATGYSSTWTPGTGGGWQQLTTGFTTGASTTSVTLYLHGWYGQGTYLADDVSLTGPGGGPAQGPATPTGLAVSASTASSISLAWTEPGTGSAATSYQVREGSTVVATSTATAATVTGLAAGTSHTYTVTALDAAGHASAASAPVTASTRSGGGTGAAWHPSYLSIGSVYTPGTGVDSFFNGLKAHGKLPDYGYEYLTGDNFGNWAATTTTMVQHSAQLGMTPVMVEYGMNGNVDGTSVDYTNMQSASWLTTYFQSLKNAATAANAAAPGKPVGWVIEPDMLGYLQQNYAAQYGGDATRFPAATSAAYASGVLSGSGDPAFGNNLTGLVQAISYTIKKYDPAAFLGWQVNTWGVRDALKDTDTMGWTAGRQSVASTGSQVAAFLESADIGYQADFVAFDQWGQDFGILHDPDPAADVRYLNAAHWSNYLLYVQTIRQSLGLPAVLWQIAVGHLNSTRTPSPTYFNASGTFPDLDNTSAEENEDSASTFFYGDSFTSSGNNLAFYSSDPGADPKVSVSGSTVTWGSHLPEAAAAGVVAVLFGAGTGTSTYGVPETSGTDQSGPGDFGYWATRTQSYLAAPTPLP
ncbi:carbohydrate binding domain-containing protein [Kitasatospora sp. NBC_01287]|uniref:carbohydrate binding domain-containing protein n=1 Tax=Kitasatospora sp. NBC_01287 TaxID=2903573 RepID=UPI0022578949|nr:carbohydrate binding domain-containing protein [Kitasatospora sp. NBC_01287]MCX4747623.1 carbohydrate binding domain-containing protein [Kitasatospora sp. NBC_01287]